MRMIICAPCSMLGLVIFIGLILWLINGQRGFRPFLKGLGIIFLVLIGVVIFAQIAAVVIPAIQEKMTLRERNQSAVEVLQPAGNRVSSPLPGLMEAEFEPDIYPSYLSAAKGLMKKVSNKLGSDYRLRKVLFPKMGRSDQEDEIRSLIPKYFPAGQAPTPPSSQPMDKIVDLSWEINDTSVRLTYAGVDGGGLAYEASYTNKPWVDEFSRFMSSQSERYLVAQSGTACTSEAEATRQAYENAAKQLVPYVQSRIKTFWSYRNVRDDEVAGSILRQLQGNFGQELVRDQFIQSFKRPYGTIWNKAVLISLQPEVLQKLSWSSQHYFDQRKFSIIGVFVSGIVLMGVICILYWLVNSYTKGYYTWKLRGIVVIGILVVIGIWFFSKPLSIGD